MTLPTVQNFVPCLGWALVHFLWQGIAVALLLGMCLRMFRPVSANNRYLCACVAMLTLAVTPVITFSHLAGQYQPPIKNGEAAFSKMELASINPFTRTPSDGTVLAVFKPESHTVSLNEGVEQMLPWAVVVWALGVMLLSGRLLIGWLQVRGLKRSGVVMGAHWQRRLSILAKQLRVRKSVRLLQSALVEVPAVIGWLRPVILLPTGCLVGLTPAQIEAILAHELAHIRRHDYLMNLLQNVAETLLFYHPAVWWVSRIIREERENCCDDLAVSVSGNRVAYARALATLEELRQAPQLALAASGSPLLGRIRRLMERPEKEAGRQNWLVAGALILTVTAVLLIVLRTNHAVAAESAPGELNVNSSPVEKTSESRMLLKRNIELKSPEKVNTLALGPLEKISTSPKPNSASVQVALNSQAQPMTKAAGNSEDSQRVIQSYSLTNLPVFLRNLEVVAGFPSGQWNFNESEDDWAPVSRSLQRVFSSAGVKMDANDFVKLEVLPILNSPYGSVSLRLRQTDIALAREVIEKLSGAPLRPVMVIQTIQPVTNVKGGSGVKTGGESTNPANALKTRVFHVNPDTFLHKLEIAVGVPVGTWKFKNGANDEIAVNQAIRKILAIAGINLDTNNPANAGKAVVFNSRKGVLMANLSDPELEVLMGEVERLNTSPAQINLKVKFVEVDSAKIWRTNIPVQLPHSPGWSTNILLHQTPMPVTNSMVGQFLGIMSEAQGRFLIKTLEQQDGADIISAPEVTTESGRQAQLQVGEELQIVTGLTQTNDTKGHPAFAFKTETVPCGLIVDVIPYLMADGFSVQLSVIGTITEFKGYDDAGSVTATNKDGTLNKLKAQVPQPHFRVRQLSTGATVYDGQTLVLSGMGAEDTKITKDKVPLLGNIPLIGRLFRNTHKTTIHKDLMMLVTATLINADGTRYHSDAQLAERKFSGAPDQPTGQVDESAFSKRESWRKE